MGLYKYHDMGLLIRYSYGGRMSEDDDHVDVAALFADLRDRNQIWDDPQFLVRDVCAITGATSKALEHFLSPDRNMVRLHGNWVNPGTGKRRMFTGSQVLMIQSAYVMNKIGFPQRFSAGLAETIERRAKNRWAGLDDGKTELTIITYPMKDRDDWALKVLHSATQETPKLPVAFHMLDADRLIDEVHAQLQAIVAGEDMPDFSIPDPVEPPNPYGPIANFFRAWEKDAEDRWIYVGLTYAETEELLVLQGSALVGDELMIVNPGGTSRESRDDGERYLELHDRHELARLKRIGEEQNAKLREAEGS